MFKVIQKKTGRINAYYTPKTKWQHQREILLFCMFLVGLICGALTVRTSESGVLSRLYTLVCNYFEVKAQQSAWINLSNVFFKRLLTLLAIYWIGTCAFGAPVLYAVPVVHGLGIGLVSAYLYASFALKGIGYCTLLLFPGEVIFCAAILLACTAGMNMSGHLMRVLSGKNDMEPITLRYYTARFCVFLLLCACSAVLETALYTVFSGYFQFS